METAKESKPKSGSENKKYNILYVDDESANLRIFNYSFNRDYNVFLASSGEEAIQVLKKHPIDLIVTDQRMPKMTGVELLKKIVPEYPNIIRMILTGFSDIGVIVEAVNAIGLHKYIQKPWDRNQLKTTFNEALTQKSKSDKLLPEPSKPQETINDTHGGATRYLGTVKMDPMELAKPAGAERLEYHAQKFIMSKLKVKVHPAYDQFKTECLLRGDNSYDEKADISMVALDTKTDKSIIIVISNKDGALDALELTSTQFELLMERVNQLFKSPSSEGYNKIQRFNARLTVQVSSSVTDPNRLGAGEGMTQIVFWVDNTSQHRLSQRSWSHVLRAFRKFAGPKTSEPRPAPRAPQTVGKGE